VVCIVYWAACSSKYPAVAFMTDKLQPSENLSRKLEPFWFAENLNLSITVTSAEDWWTYAYIWTVSKLCIQQSLLTACVTFLTWPAVTELWLPKDKAC